MMKTMIVDAFVLPTLLLLLPFIAWSGVLVVSSWTSSFVTSFRPSSISIRRLYSHHERQTPTPLVLALAAGRSSSSSSSSDEEGEGDEDWRDFRARLVMGEKTSNKADTNATTNTTTSSTTASNKQNQWAYDAGNVIEKGSIILASLKQDYGYGLSQQYFHKSVVLVLEHEENMYTKGIVLNRPTNLVLTDDDFMKRDGTPLDDEDSANKWRLWYGGEVNWIGNSIKPELTCIHSLQSESAQRVSQPVLKHHVVQYTSFDMARMLVRENRAKCDDFWLFGGYVGWGPQQLQSELEERKSWYIVATDAETVLDELRKNAASTATEEEEDEEKGREGKASPLPGVGTWERLMERIGHGDEASSRLYNDERETKFDDLMLREWCKENLILDKEDDDVEGRVAGDNDNEEDLSLLFEKIKSLKDAIKPGTLLRAACSISSNSDKSDNNIRSPFLLSEQVFHSSVILITQDEKDFTVGLILNRPLPECETFDSINIPRRYGGRYGLKQQQQQDGERPGEKKEAEKPLFWFHNSRELRNAKIGSPLGDDRNNSVWKCTREQVQDSLRSGIATEKDFLCVEGLTVWPKVEGLGSSLLEITARGYYEVVPSTKTQQVWDDIASQDVLSKMAIDKVLALGKAAWDAGGGDDEGKEEEENDTQLDRLGDEALKRWVSAMLLDEPYLRSSSEESEFG